MHLAREGLRPLRGRVGALKPELEHLPKPDISAEDTQGSGSGFRGSTTDVIDRYLGERDLQENEDEEVEEKY